MDDEETFQALFRVLFNKVYVPHDSTPVGRIFHELLTLEKGTLVVALEGTRVVGITQTKINARDSYRYDPQHEYAQTVCYGVDWIPWEQFSVDYAPTAPALGIQGIRNLENDRERILEQWAAYEKTK